MILEIGLVILRFTALLFWIAICIVGIWLMKDGWGDSIFVVFFGFLGFCAGLGLTLLSISFLL